jgi:hypothetical protein
MISGKRIKTAKLHPPSAQLLIGVLMEATNISPNHLDAENLEQKVARNT